MCELKQKMGSEQVQEEAQPLLDISLLEYHLSLTPEERIDAHEVARQLVLDLQAAGKAYYEEQSQSAS